TLVAERNVIGVDADADGQGVLDAVRRLLEDGARRICVSLDSFPEARQEQAVKRIVESQYRDHYLGSVPVLLASDMAQVDDGQPRYTRDGNVFGIPVSIPLAMLRSTPLGGGSIVRPDGVGGVRLGPESMGAAPGPACYGLGGDEATLTDAFLVLGYLDPE